MNKQPQKRIRKVTDTPETMGNIKALGPDLARSFKDDFFKRFPNDATDQLFGLKKRERTSYPDQMSGDLVEGVEINLTINTESEEANGEKNESLNLKPGIDYREQVVSGDKKIIREESRQLEKRMEDILVEIKKLASAQKELEVEFKETIVEQRIVNPGVYHLNFFDWLLSIVRAARLRIEDSGSWLSAFQSKKAKRQYWAMFKKHGTSFGLSNERAVATQTG